MEYTMFIHILTQLQIMEIDSFEITFVNDNGVEKIIKLDDLI